MTTASVQLGSRTGEDIAEAYDNDDRRRNVVSEA
jgi:hypothetical protein